MTRNRSHVSLDIQGEEMNRTDIKRHTHTCNSAWDTSNSWRNIKYLGAWNGNVIYYFIFHCLSFIHLHVNFSHSHPHSILSSPLLSPPCTLPSSVKSSTPTFPVFLFCMASEFGVSCLRFFTGARATHQWLHH